MSAKLTATKQYSRFDLLLFNRDIRKIERLKKSMTKHGYIPAYPIHMQRNGEGKLSIKAGHHRFVAAKELNLPVYYVICDDAASVHELENATNKWEMRDYLASYCRLGKPEYIRVKDYIDQTGIAITTAMTLLGGQTAGSDNFREAFKSGTYKLGDPRHAAQVADIVLYCKDCGIGIASRSLLVEALSRVCRVDGFDVEQFKRRVAINAAMVQRQPHLIGYLEMIDEIYNRGSHKKVPLVFLAKEAVKARQPCGIARRHGSK